MSMRKWLIVPALAALAATTASAAVTDDLTGVWIDHTGRGAVRIADCGGKICGRIVWLKDARQRQACGMQVIGDAMPVAGGKWDGGWIYDPEEAAKYSVELTPLGNGRLKVLGYLGTKWLGETMIWTRAPADIKTCGA